MFVIITIDQSSRFMTEETGMSWLIEAIVSMKQYKKQQQLY
jgi:hypothetical protein